MRDERSPEPADLAPEVDELAQRLLGVLDLPLHREGVDPLQLLLDLLERVEVALEHPVEEERE